MPKGRLSKESKPLKKGVYKGKVAKPKRPRLKKGQGIA